MAKESTWWDGFTDGLGELSDGVSGYFNAQAESSRAEQAKAHRAVSENATLTEQARIANLHQQRKSEQHTTMMMVGAGALVLVVMLIIVFKR